MTGLAVLSWALLTIVTAALLLLVTTAVGRVRRRRRLDRRERIRDGLRPSIIAILAQPEDPPDLPPLRGKAEDLFDVLAFDYLAKVRGESRAALVELLDRRGTVAAAERRSSRPGTVGRASAAELLGRCGLARSRPSLEALLSARPPTLRAVAVRALGHLGDPAAAPALLAVVDGARTVPPSLVAQALVRLGPAIEDDLCASLRATAPATRGAAADALGLLRAVDAVDDLIACLADDDEEPAIHAARALGRIGDPRAVAPLLVAIGASASWALAAVAARALGEVGDPTASPALGHLLAHPRPAVAGNAATALLALRDQGMAELRHAATTPPANPYAVSALSRHAISQRGSP